MRRRCLWVVDLRDIVNARLKQRGLSRYWLAVRLERKGIPRSNVYRWLAGTGDVMATVAGLALTELEVDLASRFGSRAPSASSTPIVGAPRRHAPKDWST